MIIFLFTIWDYSYDATCRLTYDNNIFSYSQVYLDDFINQIRPYRFPFESYDDLATSTDLNLLLRNRFFGSKTTTFSLGVQLHAFLNNRQKDYQDLELGIRQSFGRYALKFYYEIIPSFLVRYYRNPQGSSTDYLGCAAKYETVTGKLSFLPDETNKFELWYARKWEDYIDEFDIYDARNHIVGSSADLKLGRASFSLAYALRIAQNDSTGILSTSIEEMPDGSYVQHSVDTKIDFKLKLLSPSSLGAGYGYDFRNFATDYSADSMHYGRQDHSHRISFAAETQVLRGFLLNISYVRQFRNSSSSLLPSISDIKDYDKYRLSLGLNIYY